MINLQEVVLLVHHLFMHYTDCFYFVEIFGTFENNFRNSFPRSFVSN